MRGTVESFGDDGWGTVRAESGATFPFHCTAILDGSRTINADVVVEFDVVPGRQGRWEAAMMSPAPSS